MSTTGGSAIRGSRVGAGPMGEEDRGFKADRINKTYYCVMGHQQTPAFAASVLPEEIPVLDNSSMIDLEPRKARRLSRRVLFFHRGRLMEDAPSAAFFAQPATAEARAFLAGDLLW